MDFKVATDELMAGMTRGDLADALGKSEASIRQARLPRNNAAYRSPPQGWEDRVADLADREANRLLRLAKSIRKAAVK
jgi:hypothetical protein